MENEQAANFMEHEIEWDDSKVARLWNYYSRTPPYSEIYFAKLFGHHILRQSGLPLKATLNVLDFGCGPGYIWDHLKQVGAHWHYMALDFSPDSVIKVIEKASGNEKFAGAIPLSSLPAPLPDCHFDVVLLIEVVEHLNDAHLAGTLAEVARLLKTGGVVVISTPNEENLSNSQLFCPECGAIFHEFQHVRSWGVPSLTERLARHGFSLRMAKTLDFTSQDFTPHGLIRKITQVARRVIKGERGKPHMIAVFQKQ